VGLVFRLLSLLLEQKVLIMPSPPCGMSTSAVME